MDSFDADVGACSFLDHDDSVYNSTSNSTNNSTDDYVQPDAIIDEAFQALVSANYGCNLVQTKQKDGVISN